MSEKPKQGPPVAFRDRNVEEALAARQRLGMSPGSVASRDLERYYHLLGEELATVELSEAEACLVCDACNGLLMEPWSMRLLWAEVDDGIRLSGLAEKWRVDGPALVEKLRRLTPGQMFAVSDAVERWWNGPYREVDWLDSLRSVGLIR